MAEERKTDLVIESLFYPAFLGNMSYVAAEKLFRTPEFFDPTRSLMVIALLAHFVLDWVYSVTDDAPNAARPTLKFLADAAIIVCVYVAMRLALAETGVWLADPTAFFHQPAAWLIVAKACAVVWEVAEEPSPSPATWSPDKLRAVSLDLVFGVVYAVLACRILGDFGLTLGFALVVLADAGAYLYHDYEKRRAAGS